MAAVHDNTIQLVLLPIIVGRWTMWLLRARSGRPGGPVLGWSPAARRASSVLLAMAVVACTVLRNLPAGAFLAPKAG